MRNQRLISLGIKLSHDSSVALFEDDRLVRCHEIEKLNNNPRYSATISPFSTAQAILTSNAQ